jgi:hypothetical protein
MKNWLKGGIWGIFILAILSLINPLLIFNNSFVTMVEYFGGTINTADILFSIFSILFDGFILGAIVGLIIEKGKNRRR